MNLEEALVWFLASATGRMDVDEPAFPFRDWCRFFDDVSARFGRLVWPVEEEWKLQFTAWCEPWFPPDRNTANARSPRHGTSTAQE